MQTSRLHNIFEKDSCLTTDMIRLYADGNADKAFKHKIEKHLVDCELCSLAIEGAIAVPLLDSDVEDLHKRIDKKTNPRIKSGNARGKRFLYTIVVSLLVFGTYYFVNNYRLKEVDVPQTMHEPEPENKPSSQKVLTPAEIEEIADNKPPVQIGTAPTAPAIVKGEQVDNIKRKELFLQPGTAAAPADELPLKPIPAHDEIIYLHNCKVANVRKLYYKIGVEVNILRNVPSPNEQKNSQNTMMDDRSAVAIAILNKGLEYLSDENYSRAYDELQVLVENNEKDINALFYSALCMYNLNNTKGAKFRFGKLSNDYYFAEEANWYYALCLLKENDAAGAAAKLKEIVNTNGFYATQAKKKLRDLEGK